MLRTRKCNCLAITVQHDRGLSKLRLVTIGKQLVHGQEVGRQPWHKQHIGELQVSAVMLDAYRAHPLHRQPHAVPNLDVPMWQRSELGEPAHVVAHVLRGTRVQYPCIRRKTPGAGGKCES